jgi:hypothetical protein
MLFQGLRRIDPVELHVDKAELGPPDSERRTLFRPHCQGPFHLISAKVTHVEFTEGKILAYD